MGRALVNTRSKGTRFTGQSTNCLDMAKCENTAQKSSSAQVGLSRFFWACEEEMGLGSAG